MTYPGPPNGKRFRLNHVSQKHNGRASLIAKELGIDESQVFELHRLHKTRTTPFKDIDLRRASFKIFEDARLGINIAITQPADQAMRKS